MMILAEVSSGRSDLASASPTKDETPGSGAEATGSIGRRAALARGGKGGRAHGDDDLRIGRFDRLDRIAGVDRPLEGLRAQHLDDVGNLHHVEQRRDPRRDILAARRAGRDDRVIAAGERDDQRRQRLGEAVRVERIVGDAHLRHASEFRRARRRLADVLPGDENIDRRAEFDRGGQRARGQVAQLAVGDFRQQKRRHGQITPASSCSLATSSATDFTFTPALRPLGSVVFRTLSRGATSTP